MEVKGTLLEGIKVRKLLCFEDKRGANVVLHEQNQWDIETPDFINSSLSISRYNVLRGIHGDYRTWKEITCITGTIYFVLVDRREKSHTYNKWMGMILSDENMLQVLVPPGFGNGHYVQSAFCVFHYNLAASYDISTQFSLKWNDTGIGIEWPCTSPILSERDSGNV